MGTALPLPCPHLPNSLQNVQDRFWYPLGGPIDRGGLTLTCRGSSSIRWAQGPRIIAGVPHRAELCWLSWIYPHTWTAAHTHDTHFFEDPVEFLSKGIHSYMLPLLMV